MDEPDEAAEAEALLRHAAGLGHHPMAILAAAAVLAGDLSLAVALAAGEDPLRVADEAAALLRGRVEVATPTAAG